MEDVCRVCLASDRSTYSVEDTALEQTYNVITGDKLQRAGRPTALCCVCVSQLRRCRRFIDAAREANAALDRWYYSDHTYVNLKLSEQPLVRLTKNQIFQIMCDGALESEVIQETMESGDATMKEDDYVPYLTKEIDNEVELDYVQGDHDLDLIDEQDSTQISDDKKDIIEMSDFEDYIQYSSIKMENRLKNTNFNKTRAKQKMYSCSHCHYTTSRKSDLKNHIYIHTGEKPFACDQCDYKCARKGSLNKHLLIHTGERPFACEKCSYTCSNKSILTRHLFIHTGIKPFKCNKCDYRCNKRGNLKMHSLVHSSEMQFSCDKCDFKCKQKSNLNNHLRNHTGERPFACDICDYKSKQKSNLQKHLMIHSSVKPFKCDKCDYRTSVKETLAVHMRRHSDTKQYACEICRYRTRHRCSLKRHVKIQHENKKGLNDLSVDSEASRMRQVHPC